MSTESSQPTFKIGDRVSQYGFTGTVVRLGATMTPDNPSFVGVRYDANKRAVIQEHVCLLQRA